MSKKENIELYIATSDGFKEIIRSKTDFIKLRTNSKKLEFVATLQKEKFKNTVSFNIKDKNNIIVSGDKDNLQLINENTKVYYLNQGVKNALLYDESMVKEKYNGLTPSQLIDYRGLRGDASDNIPGVKGIGEKTGLRLIKEFGSIDNLYNKIEKQEDDLPAKLREKLIEQKTFKGIIKTLEEA